MKTNYTLGCMSLLSLLLLLALAGCVKSTFVLDDIYNVDNQRVTPAPDMTLDKAGQLIQAAGAGHDWVMSIQKPGYIVGTLINRQHTAVVDIDYTTNSFSITYKSSTNLAYDASTGQIHKGYNRWVRNLEKAILIKLTHGS